MRREPGPIGRFLGACDYKAAPPAPMERVKLKTKRARDTAFIEGADSARSAGPVHAV